MQAQTRIIRAHELGFLAPVILAAFAPFASFAAENVGEELSIASLLMYATGAAIVGLALTLPFVPFGGRARVGAGFAVSALVLIFFSFPIIQYITGVNGALLYLIAGGFTGIACLSAWLLSTLTLARRVWLTILLTLTIIPTATYVVRWLRLDSASHLNHERESHDAKPAVSAEFLPNIYYLTLDGYARTDSLREFFEFDNSDFIDFLKAKQFLVAEKSYANYMATYLSVSAALEQSFVVSENETNFWGKILWFKDILRGNNRVFRRLHELGYFIAKLDFFDECMKSPHVDYCHGSDKQQMRINLHLTELEFALLRLTPIYDLVTKRYARLFQRHLAVKNMDHVIDMVKYLNAPDPKLFFSHILLPHLPYRFAADCSPSNEIEATRLGDTPRQKELFLTQTHCANKKAKEFVRFVVQTDPHAIILLNSDHGSPFVNWSLPYDKWPFSAVRERFGILNAMRLPPECRPLYYDGISPVNFFELVFACIEHRDPNFLEDRIYISTFDKTHKQYGQVWRYR
jgi:hypothetical protein